MTGIDESKVISAFQHKSKFNFDLTVFENKLKFLGFHAAVATREDLSIDVSITNVGRTDIDKARVISFLGVRTDRHGFGILTWKHVGTQKIELKISG